VLGKEQLVHLIQISWSECWADASSANQSNFFGSSAGQDATNANILLLVGKLGI
jgi:hypothetical protein